MPKIAPSILAADFLDLRSAATLVNSEADFFHLDVMDGTFVPNISFGFPVVDALASVAEKPLDVHLMIVHPEKYIRRFARSGASMISFHLEAAGERTPEIIDHIHSLGVKAGVAINPDCPVESLYPYIGKADFFLVMSVFAGFGGQKYIPESTGRIKLLKEEIIAHASKDMLIEVDGGIGPANAGEVAGAGADILVAGSSVFKAPDPVAAINAMRGAK